MQVNAVRRFGLAQLRAIAEVYGARFRDHDSAKLSCGSYGNGSSSQHGLRPLRSELSMKYHRLVSQKGAGRSTPAVVLWGTPIKPHARHEEHVCYCRAYVPQVEDMINGSAIFARFIFRSPWKMEIASLTSVPEQRSSDFCLLSTQPCLSRIM